VSATAPTSAPFAPTEVISAAQLTATATPLQETIPTAPEATALLTPTPSEAQASAAATASTPQAAPQVAPETTPEATAAPTPEPTPAVASQAVPEAAATPTAAPAPASPAPSGDSPVAEAIESQAAAEAERIVDEQLAVASPDQITPETAQVESYTEEPIEAEEEPAEKGISVITREATVLGDILTEGHIDIVGRVKGNIEAKGDVAIHGVVRGDVGGSKIGLYSCRVKGNLDAGLGVIVDDNSIIGGDVKTKNIIFDGKVKGNIDADNVVVLRSHSYCLGDVSAASLAVEPGAILNGKVRTFVEGDLEAPFDEVM
jgi:cytoskeletal protein CcmA (bactofilin family)